MVLMVLMVRLEMTELKAQQENKGILDIQEIMVTPVKKDWQEQLVIKVLQENKVILVSRGRLVQLEFRV